MVEKMMIKMTMIVTRPMTIKNTSAVSASMLAQIMPTIMSIVTTNNAKHPKHL
jgi:hypothetical protein